MDIRVLAYMEEGNLDSDILVGIRPYEEPISESLPAGSIVINNHLFHIEDMTREDVIEAMKTGGYYQFIMYKSDLAKDDRWVDLLQAEKTQDLIDNDKIVIPSIDVDYYLSQIVNK